MNKRTLLIRYSIFASIATLLNLIAQRAVMYVNSSNYGFVSAVFVGTLVGLYVKYLLDKRWIFYSVTRGRRSSKEFMGYAITGVATTCIFWGFEAFFHFLIDGLYSRELGAVIGLAIGYVVKYRLDRTYVFSKANLSRSK